MKVLFVSGGSAGIPNNVVKNQGSSLITAGISVTYYVCGNGIKGYFSSIFRIRRLTRREKFDLVHAHYGLSGFTAGLSGCSPLVVSLMGSDIYSSSFNRFLIRLSGRFLWDKTIVKSKQMQENIGIKGAVVIPNGVNVERFSPANKSVSREQLSIRADKKVVLFISSPARDEKNFDLAGRAVKGLGDDVELMCIYNVPNEKIAAYLNAADVLLVTSRWEGSVNVIKEAMACNTPVVSTTAGDAEWLLGDIDGHFLSSHDENELTLKLQKALDYAQTYIKTDGRRRITDLGLDSEKVAVQILKLYRDLIRNGEGSN